MHRCACVCVCARICTWHVVCCPHLILYIYMLELIRVCTGPYVMNLNSVRLICIAYRAESFSVLLMLSQLSTILYLYVWAFFLVCGTLYLSWVKFILLSIARFFTLSVFFWILSLSSNLFPNCFQVCLLQI